MNERIKLLADQAMNYATDRLSQTHGSGPDFVNDFREKFAKLIVQDCANFVREDYDHEAAESIAWHMEIEYGLHGDYA